MSTPIEDVFPSGKPQSNGSKPQLEYLELRTPSFFLGGEQIILTPKLPDFNVCLSYVKFKDSAKRYLPSSSKALDSTHLVVTRVYKQKRIVCAVQLDTQAIQSPPG